MIKNPYQDWERFYDFQKAPGAVYRYDYIQIAEDLNRYKIDGNIQEAARLVRVMAKADLFFLLYFVLGVQAVNHKFIINRIYETQDQLHRTLNLWSRGHFKSTILTYGAIIWIMLNEPEARICIFSHTRDIAKSFLRRIKTTLETNAMLKMAFSDVLYMDPARESTKWSEDVGIINKRRGNYNECTLEAWGVVENMPTGRHFTHLFFDDLVTVDSVTTPEQMAKVADGFKTALNLVSDDFTLVIIGTHYHFNDLYVNLKAAGSWILREYPATHNGKRDGEPVYWTKEALEQKWKDMGTYVASCQLMLKPISEDEQTFKPDWLQFYKGLPETMNRYLLVDPAGERKEGSDQDFSVIIDIGLDAKKNIYVLDIIRDRLNLSERANIIIDKNKKVKYQSTIYEKYGMQNDITYIRERMYEEGCHFALEESGGVTVKKNDRIRWLIPPFESKKLWLPYSMKKQLVSREEVDLVDIFIKEEFSTFPFSKHDDLLDTLSRIKDPNLNIVYPYNPEEFKVPEKPYNPLDTNRGAASWRDF